MAIVYGIIMGAQSALMTLLAQIVIPSFEVVLEDTYIGVLGAATLFIGLPSSVFVGYYLDLTLRYRFVCISLTIASFVSLLGLFLSCQYAYLMGVTISCLSFGLTSFGNMSRSV